MQNKYKSLIFVGLLIFAIVGVGIIYGYTTGEKCPYCGSEDVITININNLELAKQKHRSLSLIDTRKDAKLIDPQIAEKLNENINSFDFEKYQKINYTLKGCESCGKLFIYTEKGIITF
jgi:rRNA maturation protein Nop10